MSGSGEPNCRSAAASPFGDLVQPLNASSADWVPARIADTLGIVSAVVPSGFESYLRVERDASPETDARVFDSIAAIGAERTTTPDTIVFAVWDGWGFESSAVLTSSRAPVALVAPIDELRRELRDLPRLDLPIRTYYLLTGPIESATAMMAPPWGQFRQLPDLWWPLDRAWFVAGDTDLDWIYVAGSSELTDTVAGAVAAPCRVVSPLDPVA